MAVAAHTTVIKQTGDSVVMTTEACTSLSSTVYQITNTAKRIIDPDVALTVYDNGSPVADANVTIDYLFGKVTSTAGAFTGPVTITGAYLATWAVAEARGFELNFSAEMLESTVMAAATANRSRHMGLKDCSGTVSGLDAFNTDLDSGGTTVVPFTDWGAGTRRVLEITFPSSGVIFRAFVRFKEPKVNAAYDGQVEGTLAWEASAATGTDQTEASSFGFSA